MKISSYNEQNNEKRTQDKKVLLVSGCSMTHGAGLHNNFVHPENVKKSFSQHLANKLNCQLLNVALSASSNEYIFHSILEQIKKLKNIHSIVVVWTTTGRLYWNSDGRHYFFLGDFASSMVDPVNFKMHDKTINGCWFTGDNDNIVDRISNAHQFFVTDFFDHTREMQLLADYKFALEEICKLRELKLISLEWKDIEIDDVPWIKEVRHPNASEHERIAELIYKKYYDN
jgi:hypothetical protein